MRFRQLAVLFLFLTQLWVPHPRPTDRVGRNTATFSLNAQEPTFRAESNIVVVPTLVLDRNHNTVYDLKAEDFVIEDDGVPQTVHLDETAEANPTSIVVAIQVGRRADYELPRIQGLASMLSPLVEQGHANIAVIAFDSQVHEVQNFSADPDKLTHTLRNLAPGDGGAAILDAVDSSLHLLNTTPRNRQRTLLLVSETRDHGSRKKAEEVLRELGISNTVVYALTFSPSKSNVLDTLRGKNNPDLHPEQTEVHEGPDLLAPLMLTAQAMRKNAAKSIIHMTGGEYAQFASGKNFDRNITQFTNHLHARYVLSFAPSKPHPGLHKLRVHLKQDNDATVLARENYWAAPAASPAQN